MARHASWKWRALTNMLAEMLHVQSHTRLPWLPVSTLHVAYLKLNICGAHRMRHAVCVSPEVGALLIRDRYSTTTIARNSYYVVRFSF